MKTHLRSLPAIVILLGGLVVAARAADDPAANREEKKPLRVLAGPDKREKFEKVEMETVAFLGVETAPVSAAMGSQLGLARGTGLVVNHVVPKSAAAGVLQEHDILLKLDDQILIETRQLSVLIRNHKEGDSVVLTYLRGGQKSTATVKLGKTDLPKIATVLGVAGAPFAVATPGSRFEYFAPMAGAEGERADVDRMLSMIQRVPNGEPMRIQIDRHPGPGVRAMALHTGNSSMVFSDEEGSLELSTKDGAKTLVAKNAKGEQLFSGPANTPEERKAMPAGVRERLEKLEGLHDITFRTDGDFQGAATKVMRPRGIVFPQPAPVSPTRAPIVF